MLRRWPIGVRATALLASGILLGSVTTAGASTLSKGVSLQQRETPTQHGPMPGGSGRMEQGGPTGHAGMSMEPARHYIEWMIPHHEDAVTMSELAPAQAEHLELRALAAHIMQTQTNEIARMRHWYQSWYGTEVPPDTKMGAAMHMMSAHDATPLDGARPFDKAFIEQMIPHHETAVMGSTMALQRIDRPELAELLRSIVTSQSAEIAQMRDWYQQWYGTPVPQGIGGHQMGSGMGGHQMMGGMGAMISNMGGQQPNDSGAHQMTGSHSTTDRQQLIRERGASVMPFDINQTLHRFVVLPDGGQQTVTANDPTNQAQITLIQQHLADEAQRFQRGDFSDPATLHGASMPGLADLAAAAGRMAVVYTALPDGAQIQYTSQDPQMIAALHRWFSAQLADHGSDAGAH